MEREIAVVDVFCGVGGFAHGFVQESVNVVAGIDADASCKHAFEVNNDARFVEGDVYEFNPVSVDELFPDNAWKVLIGCAPCQPYSKYNKSSEYENSDWRLLPRFAEIIASVEPDFVAMENVTRLRRYKDGSVFTEFRNRLESSDYKVVDRDVHCERYGVPQKRTRLMLLASRHQEIEFPSPTHDQQDPRTVRDAIGGLPALAAGEQHPEDRLHKAAGLSEKNLRRIRQSEPGGTWEDWDDDLVADCHRRSSGSGYQSIYGRMEWDEPAPTITTQCYNFGSGRFGHPEQDRAISLREAALLQSFPSDYEFGGPNDSVYLSNIGRYVGNAVPPKLGRCIARTIKRHLRRFS